MHTHFRSRTTFLNIYTCCVDTFFPTKVRSVNTNAVLNNHKRNYQAGIAKHIMVCPLVKLKLNLSSNLSSEEKKYTRIF